MQPGCQCRIILFGIDRYSLNPEGHFSFFPMDLHWKFLIPGGKDSKYIFFFEKLLSLTSLKFLVQPCRMNAVIPV